jgi:hypothetical protein
MIISAARGDRNAIFHFTDLKTSHKGLRITPDSPSKKVKNLVALEQSSG